MNKLYVASPAFIDGAVGLGGSFRQTYLLVVRQSTSTQGKGSMSPRRCSPLRTQQARGLRSRNDAQVCYRRREGCQNMTRKLPTCRQNVHVLLWPNTLECAKDSTILKLHRPQQKQVSILDDLVGEEASLSTIRGGARCSTLQVQDRPRQQQHCSQDSHTFVNVSSIL